MPITNLIPINTEVELTEAWSVEDRLNSDVVDIMQELGLQIPKHPNGSFKFYDPVKFVLPAGMRIVVRRYNLNQGNINGEIRITVRLRKLSPKIEIPVHIFNGIEYKFLE